jgi:hypothetical protein
MSKGNATFYALEIITKSAKSRWVEKCKRGDQGVAQVTGTGTRDRSLISCIINA